MQKANIQGNSCCTAYLGESWSGDFQRKERASTVVIHKDFPLIKTDPISVENRTENNSQSPSYTKWIGSYGWYTNKWSYLFWNCSFCRSKETTELIWWTRRGTLLPKLMWNSLPKACSSFCSSLHRMLSGTSASTKWRWGTTDATLFKKQTISFFGNRGIETKIQKQNVSEWGTRDAFQQYIFSKIINRISMQWPKLKDLVPKKPIP